jgi:thiamine-monophosphate kinase
VAGEIATGCAVSRGGARPGDSIFVSGRLGGSQLGLDLILRGIGRKGRWRKLLAPHFYPKPAVELGCWLARRRLASAMMDISDGLSSDLARLCKASGVGARLAAERIPCVAIPPAAARALRLRPPDPLRMALDGGEDYELLFTVPERNLKRLRSAPRFAECTAVGEIEPGLGTTLVGRAGDERRLPGLGWDPFS